MQNAIDHTVKVRSIEEVKKGVSCETPSTQVLAIIFLFIKKSLPVILASLSKYRVSFARG